MKFPCSNAKKNTCMILLSLLPALSLAQTHMPTMSLAPSISAMPSIATPKTVSTPGISFAMAILAVCGDIQLPHLEAACAALVNTTLAQDGIKGLFEVKCIASIVAGCNTPTAAPTLLKRRYLKTDATEAQEAMADAYSSVTFQHLRILAAAETVTIHYDTNLLFDSSSTPNGGTLYAALQSQEKLFTESSSFIQEFSQEYAKTGTNNTGSFTIENVDVLPLPAPSSAPSEALIGHPAKLPSRSPSASPSHQPSHKPVLSHLPSHKPVLSHVPSHKPVTLLTTSGPTRSPTLPNTAAPTASPTVSAQPSSIHPSSITANEPTRSPSHLSSSQPAVHPTTAPIVVSCYAKNAKCHTSKDKCCTKKYKCHGKTPTKTKCLKCGKKNYVCKKDKDCCNSGKKYKCDKKKKKCVKCAAKKAKCKTGASCCSNKCNKGQCN